jgi:hypothetical protein
MAWTDWMEGFRRREFSGFLHKTKPRRRRSSRRERHRRSVLLETLEPRLLLATTHEIESNDSLALATGLALTQTRRVSSRDSVWVRSVRAATWTTGGSRPRRATG